MKFIVIISVFYLAVWAGTWLLIYRRFRAESDECWQECDRKMSLIFSAAWPIFLPVTVFLNIIFPVLTPPYEARINPADKITIAVVEPEAPIDL